MVHQRRLHTKLYKGAWNARGGWVLLDNSRWGCAAKFFKSWPDFRPKNVIFYTGFQTIYRPLKSIPVFRPGFRQKLCYHYIDYSANQKNIQIHFEFAYFSFFPYSLELNDKYVHTSVVSSKNIPDSRPKWAKCIPVFRSKRRKNLPRWGGTHHGVPPPPLSACRRFLFQQRKWETSGRRQPPPARWNFWAE